MKTKYLIIAYLTVGYLFSYVFANDYNSYRYILGDKEVIDTNYIDSKFNYSDINIDINLCKDKKLAEISGVYTGLVIQDIETGGVVQDIECYNGLYELSGVIYTGGFYRGGYCENGYFLDNKFYNLGECYDGLYELSGAIYTGGSYKGGYCTKGKYVNGQPKYIYISCSKESRSIKELYETTNNLYVISDFDFSENKIYTDDNGGETYSNGKDYVFSNISEIASVIDFAAPSDMSYIHENFLSYDKSTQKFLVKDVCENNDCSIANIDNINTKYLSYADFQGGISLVKNLQKNINTNELIVNNNLFVFYNTSIPELEYTAGSSLGSIGLGLAINMPYNTQPGDRFRYTYTIFLRDDNGVDYDINEDKFVIANSGGQIGIYGYKYNEDGCIDNNNDGLCDLFDINEVFDGAITNISMVLTGTFKDVALVKIIERGTSVQKAGEFRFGVKLDIDGLTENTLSSSKLSEASVIINPGEISQHNSYIKLTTEVPEKKTISNEEIVHFKGDSDTLAFRMYLKDSYGNEVTKGSVTVCYKNENVKIDNNDGNYESKCKNVTYNGGYNFKLYFTEYGRYKDFKLSVDNNDLEVIRKNDNPLTINVISDSEAAEGGHYDTFNCTNRNIYYEYSCSYDVGPAGCYTEKGKVTLDSDGNLLFIDNNCSGTDCNLNFSFLFDSEIYNLYGNNPESLLKPVYVMDNAGNRTRKLFLLSHIDKTFPRVSISDNLFTNNSFILTIDDTMSNHPDNISIYPGGCKVNGQYEFILKNIKVSKNGSLVYERSNYRKLLLSPKGAFIFTENQDDIFYKKPGKYDVKIKVSDKAGNITSLNKEIKVLPNTNFSVSNINIENSSYVTDGYTVFTGWFELRDSYGNNIFGNYYDSYPFKRADDMMRLINSFGISYDGVVINELSNENGGLKRLGYGFDEGKGKYYFRFVAYNNIVKNGIKLKLVVNLYDVMGNVDNNNTKEFYLPISPNFSSVFKEGKVYSPEGQEIGNHNGFTLLLSEDGIPAFNQDIPIIFNIYTTGFNNPEGLKNVMIHANIWAIDGENCSSSNKDEGISITASSGYESIFKDLLSDGGYLLGNIGANSTGQLQIKIRLERIGGNANTNIKLCSTGFVSYGLSYGDDYRTVVKKVNWVSNVEVKYWGVFVEGLVSNTVKGLYEILRESEDNSLMSKGVQKQINNTKIKVYTSIIRKVSKLVRGVSTKISDIHGEINGIYYNDGNIIIGGGNNTITRVVSKSLIYSDGGNIIINGNIKKDGGILTIVAKSKNNNGGYIYISPNVTNIDAILVSEKGIFPYSSDNLRRYMLQVVKGSKDAELNNQLLIYGMVISRGNTIGGSIRIGNSYVIPGGKKIFADNLANFYRAAIYDLNYLRRYHYTFNRGNEACDEKSSSYDNSCFKLNTSKYGTYPVIIKTDPEIKTKKPYGF